MLSLGEKRREGEEEEGYRASEGRSITKGGQIVSSSGCESHSYTVTVAIKGGHTDTTVHLLGEQGDADRLFQLSPQRLLITT